MMARRSKMAAKVFKYGIISFLLSSPAKIYNLLDVNSYDVIDRFSSLLLDIKIPKTSYPNARRFFFYQKRVSFYQNCLGFFSNKSFVTSRS